MAAKPQGQQKLKIRLWRTIKSNKNNWHIKIHSEIPEIFIAFWFLGGFPFGVGWAGKCVSTIGKILAICCRRQKDGKRNGSSK